MNRILTVAAVIFLGIFSVGGCGGSDMVDITVPGPEPEAGFSFEPIFSNLTFKEPLDIQNPGDGSGRLFVAEKQGLIHVINTDTAAISGTASDISQVQASSDVFLDITDRVGYDDTERGLLGFTFHPDYENNGYLYVNYIAFAPDRSVISRFTVSADDPDHADPDSEVILLEIPQPAVYHNGGALAFGPFDGYLYITMGDGGVIGGGDGNSQNLGLLLGKILRIDVDNPAEGLNYGIPPDNPFAGNVSGIREEIYAYGFRNPFKMSFDSQTGTLWAGDVGELSREEVDVVENGKNYGWNITEGTLCFDPPSGCDMSGLEPPVFEYGRNVGRTVIAGTVYRGNEIPGLTGMFIYGDFVSGRIWALEYDGSEATDNTLIDQFFETFSLTSFGTDEQNEMYATAYASGKILRLARADEE